MRYKISEKQGLVGLIFLLGGLLLFFSTAVIKTPVRVSEKDLLLTAFSLVLLVFGTRRLKGAIHRL